MSLTELPYIYIQCIPDNNFCQGSHSVLDEALSVGLYQSTCVENVMWYNMNVATTTTLYISIVYRVKKNAGRNYDCTWHKSFFFLLTFLDYFYHAWSKHLRSWSSENKPEVFLFPMWLTVKRTNANAMWSFGMPILCGEYVQVNKQLRLFSSAVFFLTYVYVRVLNTRQWTSLRITAKQPLLVYSRLAKMAAFVHQYMDTKVREVICQIQDKIRQNLQKCTCMRTRFVYFAW